MERRTRQIVVILTMSEYAALEPHRLDTYDEYHRNVLVEDSLLATEIEHLGFQVRRVGWDDPAFDWDRDARAIVLRTVWDYFHRYPEFSVWFNHMIDLSIPFFNSPQLLVWNMDKHYLEDLQERRIRIVPSTFVEKGVLQNAGKTLGELVEENLPWKEYVVKPCVSGCARETYRVTRGEVPPSVNETYARLNEAEAFLVQPFQHRIDQGEVSIVVINGECTHAVLKKPKPGDFRVQDDFGGTVEPYILGTEEKVFALQCIAACDEVPLFARVDIVRDNTDQWALSELEFVDPELWFRHCPTAARVAAEGFARRISQLEGGASTETADGESATPSAGP